MEICKPSINIAPFWIFDPLCGTQISRYPLIIRRFLLCLRAAYAGQQPPNLFCTLKNYGWCTQSLLRGFIFNTHIDISLKFFSLLQIDIYSLECIIVYSNTTTYDMCIVEITKAFPRTNFEKTRQLKKVESTTTYYKVELSLNWKITSLISLDGYIV